MPICGIRRVTKDSKLLLLCSRNGLHTTLNSNCIMFSSLGQQREHDAVRRTRLLLAFPRFAPESLSSLSCVLVRTRLFRSEHVPPLFNRTFCICFLCLSQEGDRILRLTKVYPSPPTRTARVPPTSFGAKTERTHSSVRGSPFRILDCLYEPYHLLPNQCRP